jgi:LysR family transcriptional regulator, glycine cleavage system transcriptional activator
MARLPLNTLPAFRVAAKLQNLRAAAEQLHLTHSAVSQQIALLEAQLGLPVFDRRGRGLVLNAAGQALLRAVEPALDGLAQGVMAAQAAAGGQAQQLRITVVPSFAQRWLLPRMPRWHARHPDILLDVHASLQVVDLAREGFHAALRAGKGPWKGLAAERLIESPLIAVAAPARAARLRHGDHAAIAAEPLLGSNELWEEFLALCGCPLHGKTVADFNDSGLMLQAVESDLGIALARELLAADALQAGRLVRVSPLSLPHAEGAASYWLLHPTELTDWPPLVALRQWLADEMALSRQALGVGLASPPVKAARGAAG